MGINQFGEETNQKSPTSSHRRTMKEEGMLAVENNNEWIYTGGDGGIQQNQKMDQEPEQLCEVSFGSDSTLKHFKSPKVQPLTGTDKSETSKNCRKCKKLREKAAKSQKSKKLPKQSENLSTEKAMENSKILEAESGSKTRQKSAQSSTSKALTSKPQESSESQKKKKKYAGTQPVYMPRSKYYRDTDNNSSKGERSRRQRKRDRSSSTRRQQRNGKNQKKEKHQKQHRQCETSCSSSSLNITKIDDNDNMFFIGSYTAVEVAKILKPNEFRIYYQIPEKPTIAYKLRLFLSYMSNQNKEVFHFPVVCGKNSRSGENMWSLRYTDSATFPSLLALIKYHKTYAYMDPSTGKIDTFPVWKGAIIDDDSFTES